MSERRYGWVMVALGAFMTCIAIGAMFSLAVFLRPITEATGWAHTAVSNAMTLNFLAVGDARSCRALRAPASRGAGRATGRRRRTADEPARRIRIRSVHRPRAHFLC